MRGPQERGIKFQRKEDIKQKDREPIQGAPISEAEAMHTAYKKETAEHNKATKPEEQFQDFDVMNQELGIDNPEQQRALEEIKTTRKLYEQKAQEVQTIGEHVLGFVKRLFKKLEIKTEQYTQEKNKLDATEKKLRSGEITPAQATVQVQQDHFKIRLGDPDLRATMKWVDFGEHTFQAPNTTKAENNFFETATQPSGQPVQEQPDLKLVPPDELPTERINQDEIATTRIDRMAS